MSERYRYFIEQYRSKVLVPKIGDKKLTKEIISGLKNLEDNACPYTLSHHVLSPLIGTDSKLTNELVEGFEEILNEPILKIFVNKYFTVDNFAPGIGDIRVMNGVFYIGTHRGTKVKGIEGRLLIEMLNNLNKRRTIKDIAESTGCKYCSSMYPMDLLHSSVNRFSKIFELKRYRNKPYYFEMMLR